MEKIVLASGSPRRKELLARTGLKFSVVASDGEEKTDLTDPAEMVEKLSFDKAMAVAGKLLLWIRYPDFRAMYIRFIQASHFW